MGKNIFIGISGLIIGMCIGYMIFMYSPLQKIIFPQKQVIGFLPYWLINKANQDYTKYITTLTYFSLSVDKNGNIVKLNTPREEDPGWHALRSEKLKNMFATARKNNINLSLLIASGDQKSIEDLIYDPIPHAKHLIKQVLPIMHEYGFTDLNLDIEYVQPASDEGQMHFVQFVKEVKKGLGNNATLTVEIQGTDLIKKDLIKPEDIIPFADKIVVMTYDYHYQGSGVTGPVAPLRGAQTLLEYDVTAAIQLAEKMIPPEKIILGVSLYGYEWETLDPIPHAGVMPGSGLTVTNLRAEQFIASCATCSAQFDTQTQEAYVIYKDQETGTFHQMFYPTEKSTRAKVNFATQQQLGGIALWALGYEGKTILNPLKAYKNQL